MAIAQPIQEGQYPSDVEATIAAVKDEFKGMVIKRRELVMKIGEKLQGSQVVKPESICAEIKEILRDEIKEKLISESLIEDYCPAEWKNSQKADAGRQGAVVSTANERKKKVAAVAGGGSETETTTRLEKQVSELTSWRSEVEPVLEVFHKLRSVAENLQGSCDCETCLMARKMHI